jgi:hypothetical protein
MSNAPFGPNFSDKPPVVQSNPYGDQPINPYAAPSSDFSMALPQSSGGVFRLNGKMVMHKQAILPPRCIKTGEPAETAVSKKLYWHHPAFFLVIFLHVFIYVVVALIVRKSMTFAFPLTNKARGKLRMRIAIGVVCLLSAFGAMIGGFALANNQAQGGGGEVFGFAGLILFFILFITSIVFFYLARLVTPTKITDQFTIVKGVSPEYLAILPDWPYGPVIP